MEKEIQKYKIEGKIAVWKFIENSKNYPGWNICFDDHVRNSIITLLEKMNNSEWPSKKEIKLTNPLELNQDWIKNNGSFSVAHSLIISNRKEPSDLWEMSGNDSELTITFGSSKLNELKEGISKQLFDEAISGNQDSETNILYFW